MKSSKYKMHHKLFNIVILSSDFPRMARLEEDYLSDIYITKSPFCDCQTFAIGGLETLLSWSCNNKISLQRFVTTILVYASKTQCIVDVRKDKYKEIFKLLDPFIKEKKSMRFDSINGTEMIVVLIQFKKKFKEISLLPEITQIEKLKSKIKEITPTVFSWTASIASMRRG